MVSIKTRLFKFGAGGITEVSTTSKEIIRNTQRLLEIGGTKKQISYPPHDAFWSGKCNLIQVDKDTFYPLVIHSQDTLAIEIRDAVAQYQKMQETIPKDWDASRQGLPSGLYITKVEAGMVKDNAGKEQQVFNFTPLPDATKKIFDYLNAPKLEPFIDSAYKYVYAENVKQILDATANRNSLIDRLYPMLMLVAFGLAMVFILYGGTHWIAALPSHIAVTCQNFIQNVTTSINQHPVVPVV